MNSHLHQMVALCASNWIGINGVGANSNMASAFESRECKVAGGAFEDILKVYTWVRHGAAP